MTKEDFSLWTHKKKCRLCGIKFGSDNPQKKERCYSCTWGRKNHSKTRKLMYERIAESKAQVPGKYDIHEKRVREGWLWGKE